MRSTNKRFRSKSRPPTRRLRPTTRLQVELLEERLAPDAGGPFQGPSLPITVEPDELRQLLMFGDGFQPGDDLSGVPEFYVPDLAAILSPVSGSLPGSFGLFGPFGPAGTGIDDPGALGSFSVTTEDYDFGNIFDPPFIPGTATVELTARVHAPTDLTGGARPILFFLHGNHASTFSGTSAAFEWPPAGGRQPLPNYQGYDYLGQVLASHGYIVVSVSTNGVNVLGSPTPGTGMQARAELMQRHLDIWRDLSETGVVTGVPGTPSPFGDRFVGKVDLQSVGTMGHSRGGEGVVAHFQHNQSLGEPYDIDAVFSLAPVDFQARTITNVPHAILLPYHDGDVSDLQGARFFDRERYALAGDMAPKHVIEVLGANHNFYNTNWTPGLFPAGASDDGAATGIAIAEPPTPGSRLNAARTRGTSIAYITAFFRTYVGNDTVPAQTQFFRYLTGDLAPPPSAMVAADRVFLTYQPPDLASARLDVNRLTSAANLTTNTLGGTVTPSGLSNYAFGATFQGLQALQLGWNSAGASWQNNLGPGGQDISRYFALQFRAAVPVNALNPTATQDFSIVLTDGAGNTARTRVSDVYEERSTPLFVPPLNNISRKAVLNGVRIPLSAFAGVDLTDVRSIRFEFDQRPTGFLWLSDLMFANASLGFAVTSTSPAAGEVVATTPPTTFVVTLSDAYDPTSVDPEDLTVNDIAANSVTFTNPTTLTFHYDTSPVTAEGLQTLALAAGAIRRLGDDELLDGFTTRFRFDALSMEVISTVPAVDSLIELPFTTLDLILNEAPNPDTVGTNDLTLSMGTVTAVEVINPTTLRYTLSGLDSEGTLTVRAATGAWTDEFGNPSREFTGTYTLDFGTVAFPVPLVSQAPAGSLVYDGSRSGIISAADDTDSFTISVDTGQTVTVVVRPTAAGLRPTVSLREGDASRGRATAPSAGTAAILQTVGLGDSGSTRSLTVTVGSADGTTGAYTVQVILNAAVELEANGGPTNNTPTTAQDLLRDFIKLGGPATRAAVLGTTATTADQDWYRFSLGVGASASLALRSLTGGAVQLALAGPDGQLLTLGATGTTNVDGFIGDFVATETGTYFARVTGAAGAGYNLVITSNAAFDAEPNNISAAAQTIVGGRPGSGQTVLGHVAAGTDLFDLRGTPAPGGLVLTGSQITLGINADGSYVTGLTGIQFLNNEFVVPGTQLAGFTIGRSGANFTNKGAVGTTQITVTKENLSSGSFRGVRIVGTVGGNLLLERVIAFNEEDEFATIATRLTNVGGTTLTNVAWLENLDPDQGQPTTGAFGTFNDVVLAGQLVRAHANTTAFPNGLTIGLGSADSRRVVSAEGFDVRDPFAIINSPVDPNGVFEDIAINLAFNYGSLAPGQSTTSALVMTFGRTVAEAEATYEANATSTTLVGDVDHYRVALTEGALLELQTATPADDPGEFSNGLDARIRVFDAAGNLVAEDDNSAPDGRNALLSFTVPSGGAGEYVIEVSASPDSPEPTRGEYVLSIRGATPVLPDFQVTAITPADGARLRIQPTQAIVDFNDGVLLSSLQASDLTIDGVSATSFTAISGTRVVFDLPGPLSDGDHVLEIAAGAILDLQGTPVQAFSSTFFLDATPPQVVASSVGFDQVLPVGDLTMTIEFSEAMNQANLSATDFSLRGVFRAVNYNPVSFSYNAEGTVLAISYTNLPEDQYTLTLISADGAFEDVLGNNLDGDANGTEGPNFVVNFSLDVGITPFPLEVAPVQPLGSLIYEATIPGLASGAADIDFYTIDLDAGQTLTVLFDVPPTSLLPSLFVLDPSGVQVGSSTGGAGGDLVLQTIPVTTSGVYSVVVVGIDTGSAVVIPYALRLTLNAALEAERFGGPANDTSDTAQDIGDSFLVLGDGDVFRGAVLGAAASAADEDWYTFNIDAGDSATLALTALGAGTVSLLLADPNGATLATGTGGATNVSQAIRDFVAPVTGNYFVRVTGSAGVNYSLVATRNVAFDLEPNDSLAAAQPLPPSGVALGHIGSVATGTSSTTLPLVLFDGTGFRWDIQGNGNILDGTSDAYDGGLVHAGFPSQSAGTLEDGGREVVIGPATVGAAQVTRKVFVPADQGYARFLEIITNPGATTITYTVTINTDLGSDGSEVIVGTSSGDTVFTIADNWIITDDADGAGDPTLLHIIAGSGGRIRPSAASRPSGLLNYSYQLTLAPGETQIVMHFASQNANRAGALARAPELTALGQGALAGLTPQEAAAIVNFDVTGVGVPGDFYHFTASAGDMITLLTRTPADGLGQFANILDAVIELYDPDGNLVASDDNGGDDGRNAFLTFQAVASGVYTVRVLAAGTTSGEYVLDLDLDLDL